MCQIFNLTASLKQQNSLLQDSGVRTEQNNLNECDAEFILRFSVFLRLEASLYPH